MNIKDLLAVTQKSHLTIPAFSAGSDQLLKVVMEEVKELNSPAILEMSPDEFNFMGDAQIQAMIYGTTQTDVPVCIRLDHGDSYETTVRAIRVGITSVMIDAFTLPYEENVAVTKKVVETAHIANASVESELGTIGTAGNSVGGGTRGVIYTVPEGARQFIEDTEVDTLAVAIGTAHGIYLKGMKPEPRIDILKDIASKVDVPLILYGGSSNKDRGITTTADNGICRISISNDIKVTFYTRCRKTLNENPDYREPLEIYPETMKVCGKVIGEKIRLFGSNDKVRYCY